MTAEKPKPCPFCGGSAKLYTPFTGRCFVGCRRSKTCDTLGPAKKTGEDAIKAWNKAPREAGK